MRQNLGEPYLIAFVDLNLEQNLNGVDVAIRLRELDPKIQIVIITAYFDRRDEDRLHRELGTGNFHFLRKPFKMAAMKKLVDELCHRPSADEHQTLQSIELPHLDDVAETLKLSEEFNRESSVSTAFAPFVLSYRINESCSKHSPIQIINRDW